ncbi:MAG TPA: hypothetical protein VFB43_14395 [Terracidiphilus sp.]|jgi:hypothetical protein|nr:hypothetical protein [Terracidiphilus sp.]
MRFSVPASAHTAFHWRVRTLASDFHLEDTWEFPYEFGAEDGVDLHVFQKRAIEPMMKGIYDVSVTGLLFRVRKVLGALFRIDVNLNNFPVPGCREKAFGSVYRKVISRKTHRNARWTSPRKTI